MVSPSEIDRVDVIYGPFSALYPGNSAGGIVNMTTRMPNKLEFHGGVDVIQQHYSLFGTNSNYYGNHESASVGNRVGDVSFLAGLDHFDNKGEPMTFGSQPAATKGGAGGLGAVTGAISYLNPANVPTLVTSAIGIDHSVQNNSKFKIAYDFTPTVRATYTLGLWDNNSFKTSESYLRNAAGQTIYGGAVKINGLNYTVAPPATTAQVSQYYMHGLKLKSDSGGRWDWEVDASMFNQGKENTRTATAANGAVLAGNINSATASNGTILIGDGTGWKNLDLRGDFRPDGDLTSVHQLSYGFHTDQYILRSATYNLVAGTSFLASAPAGINTASSRGQTQTQALYLQDAWQMATDWKLVVGGRMENWQASDGRNLAAGVTKIYQNRSVNAFSPKVSLSYQASEDWGLRGSFGTGTRFPTVNELFSNLTVTPAPAPAGYGANNPNLKPETVNSVEFTVERHLDNGLWRNSLFGEDKKNAIITTTDTATLPGYTISGNVNVDAVRTIGFETALEAKNLWKPGFDFSGSATWVNSIITANAGNPILVGTDQPRIPKFRTTLSGTYHFNEQLSFSANYRFSGRQHVSLYTATGYVDPNPNVYGTTVSKYSVIDLKTLYKFDKQWSASFGVNNLTNCQYFVNPNPYPMRTIFASAKYDM
jgi:iron complex outermembrane receptor protein